MSTEGGSADIRQTLALLVTKRLRAYADTTLRPDLEAAQIVQGVLSLMRAHHQRERATLKRLFAELYTWTPGQAQRVQQQLRHGWQNREYTLALLAHAVHRHLDGSTCPLLEHPGGPASPFVP